MSHARCYAHTCHRLSCDEYDILLGRAGSACEICRIPEGETRIGYLHIDHDHAVGGGAVRGLLCGKCNAMMSRIERGEIPVSAAAAAYHEAAFYKSIPPRWFGEGPRPYVVNLWLRHHRATRRSRPSVAAWKGRQPKPDHDAASE